MNNKPVNYIQTGTMKLEMKWVSNVIKYVHDLLGVARISTPNASPSIVKKFLIKVYKLN
jgi:hypothetical protein